MQTTITTDKALTPEQVEALRKVDLIVTIPEPKPLRYRLSNKDIPELEKDLRLVDSVVFSRIDTDYDRAIYKHRRAFLFLCIETLKLDGEVMSKPNESGSWWRVQFNRQLMGWDIMTNDDFITCGQFWFPSYDVAKAFLSTPGVQEALMDFYMIQG